MKWLKNGTALGATVLAAMLVWAVPPSQAQTAGTALGNVTFATNCGKDSGGYSVGVGIAFDGTNLWYSCTDAYYLGGPDLIKANPTTGAMIASYKIAGGLGAIAYDATRNVIWAGEGDGNAFSDQVIEIPLDSHENATNGTFTVAFSVPEAFNAPATKSSLVDGLAVDPATNLLYIHYDYATTFQVYNIATGTYVTSINEDPNIPLGTPVYFSVPSQVPNGQCIVSGLAIGGSDLLEAADYCDYIYGVEKATQTELFNFGFFGNPSAITKYFDPKGLACDPVTFPGSDAVWVKDAFTPRAFAYALPAGSCGVGGLPGLPGTLTVSPTNLNFGKVVGGSTSPPQSVTVTNGTSAPVTMNQTTVDPTGSSGYFLISTDGCSGMTLAASGGTCSVAVTFTATSTGPTNGTLTLTDGATTLTVTLKGQGSKK